MATPISALEHVPADFVHEVSPEAIDFYVESLAGLYLPKDFREEHAGLFDVEYWDVTKRLHGKFGRFAVRSIDEGVEEQPECNDILLMGSTIGLHRLDRYGYLDSLRHYVFKHKVSEVLEQRGIAGGAVWIDPVDYGATTIVLNEEGATSSIKISGSSIDFGRADAEGRTATCRLFEDLVGMCCEVLNQDPEPREHERIIER